ncbi:c-type cytochrome [Dyadobacter psychrotolerans]|uniref:Cytochrome c n=1 Tax=Dyadobacter psychrotolerans TaxID=2541721 RepID=A0A4R5DI90_9BACT|nr:cytochrome c [Dyadobacter psychrotolerans]TDE13619.1 cytochrome c [Dyadobacter psychrotolerans]
MKKKLLFLSFLILCLQDVFAQKLTFKDIEPIITKNCVSCHRPGDAAPFSLITYQDVSKRITTIKKVITSNYMPPWRADNHYREFANDRSLSEAEKSKILSWIDNKAPKGDYSEKSDAAKQALLNVTSYNRKPDLTLKIDSSFTVKGDNKERFVVFKIPFDFAQAQNIEAVELYSNNKKIIHHINYGFYDIPEPGINIQTGEEAINTTDDEMSSTKLLMQERFKKKMVYYTGWIPGTSVENYPKNFGWILPKRGVVIITAHYSPGAVDESSVVGVNLFYRKENAARQVKVISLGSGGIGERDITPPLLLLPNDISRHTLHVKTQEDQSVMFVWPHMHYLGKEFYAYAVSPAGDTIKLVHIPQWDFRWQELYKVKKLVKVPKGSVIHLDCTYDNTADNPFNPNNPPKPVFSFGDMNSKNEMMTLLLIYANYKEGDENIVLDE